MIHHLTNSAKKKIGILAVPLFLLTAFFLSQRDRATDPAESRSLVCHGARAKVESGTSLPEARGIAPNAEAANIADNGFGIAAGGDIVYWEQEDLNMYFQELKDLGAAWVRWDVDWQAVQSVDSEHYDWTGVDRVAATAQKFGIRSLGIITYAPRWAQAQDCPSGKKCPPESADTFADFAFAAAQRYERSIDAWEIWNEPNYNAYWYPAPDAADYAALLKAAYVKIKEANPDTTVVSGGLTDMGNEAGISISPLTFVDTMYEQGAKDNFDALALHPYTYPGYDYGWPQIISIRKAMETNGDSEKKIWITEYGAPTGGPGKAFEIGQEGFSYGEDFMSEEAQGRLAESIFAFRSAHGDYMGNVFWYTLCDDSTDTSASEDFFGILRYDGTKKPVYRALKGIFSKL